MTESVEIMLKDALKMSAEGCGGQTEAIAAVALALVEINKNLETIIKKGIRIKDQVTAWNGKDT